MFEDWKWDHAELPNQTSCAIFSGLSLKLAIHVSIKFNPPNDSHSSWLKWWNYGNISKSLDNASSPKKNSPGSPFLKGRLLIPGPQVCKICAEIYQKTTPKRYKFYIFGRSMYNNLPVFPPMFWCPLFRIFPPPPLLQPWLSNSDPPMKGLIPSWRTSAPGVLWRWICGSNLLKTWVEWRLVILMLRLVILCVHNRRVSPYVNFLVFIGKRGPFLKKRLKFGKNSGLTSPDLAGNIWFIIGCISTYSLLTM